MKYRCPKCGRTFSEKMNFCPDCGVKLTYPETTERVEDSSSNDEIRVIKARIKQLKSEIATKEEQQTIGIVLTAISVFCVFLLIIPGLILWIGSYTDLNRLHEEKHELELELIRLEK